MRASSHALPAESSGPWARDVAWLFLAVFAAYATAIPGDFVWLDHVEIEQGGYRVVDESDWLRVWTLSLDQYLHRNSGVTEVGGGYWRPVYAISLSLDWALWGARAWLYHVENVVWHLAVVIGLYALGRRLLAQHPSAQRVAFWAALLFAVHPLGVQSVTWISGRKDLMCAAFGVASLLAFFEVFAGRGAAEKRRHFPASGITLAGVLLALSVGSKELGFVVPLAASVLLAWMPVGQSQLNLRSARRHQLMSLGILWGCAVGLAAFRVGAVGVAGLNADRPSDSLIENIATHATLWWHYVGLVLLPEMPSISDGWPVAKRIGAREALAIFGVAASVPMLTWAVRRRWVAAPPLLWFVVWMIPAMGFVPLRHVRAERYLYPASWGLLMAALLLLAHVWPMLRARGLPRAVPKILACSLASALVLTTAYENSFWWHDDSLFERAVRRDPRYVEGRVGLARLALDRGDYDITVDHSRRALAEARDRSRTGYCPWFVAHTNLGLALLYLNRSVGARLEFDEALRLRPKHAVAHYHLGLVALTADQLEIAKQHFQSSLALDPDDPLTIVNLAATHLRLGEWTPAVDLLSPLAAQSPDDAIVLKNLTTALLRLARFDEAEPLCEQMARLAPNDPEQLAKWAWALFEVGRRADAIASWRRAQARSPSHPAVRRIGRMLGQE